MASNNAKITRELRDQILAYAVSGRFDIAQVVALRHGLASNYPWKLARARGLVPRTAKRWGNLREAS